MLLFLKLFKKTLVSVKMFVGYKTDFLETNRLKVLYIALVYSSGHGYNHIADL
jgi:hypothetical protein